MPSRRLIAAALVAVLLGGALLLSAPARGEPSPDDARAAMTKAVQKGREIYEQRWGVGSKPCAECHGPGPNRMRAGRLKAYPKWDKTAGKVITGQQKLDQMITVMSKGQALGLGSDDLNALEAYVATLR